MGEDVSLRCPLLETSSGTLSWYRKVPGRSPELLLSTRGSSGVRFGPGFGPDRVQAAADGSLVLAAAQRSDSGLYFCSFSPRVQQQEDERTQPFTWTGA